MGKEQNKQLQTKQGKERSDGRNKIQARAAGKTNCCSNPQTCRRGKSAHLAALEYNCTCA